MDTVLYIRYIIYLLYQNNSFQWIVYNVNEHTQIYIYI